MHETNIQRLDLNLLVVFAAVEETRSVTAAARRLALSQPAVSHALGRLRDVTGDALFVRGRGGLVATPRAEAMAGPVREALAMLAASLRRPEFEPAEATGTFRIGVSDYALATVGQGLLRRLRQLAPGCVVEFRAVGERSLAMLESGDLDAVFWGGGLPDPPLRMLELFRERLAGLMAADHPLARRAGAGGLSLDDYLGYPHVIASWREPHRSAVDAALDRLGRARRVAVITPSFAANIAALKGTDLIMSLPSRLIDTVDLDGFVRFDLPLALDDYAYRLVWHPRTEREPALVWLREIVRQVAND